MMPIDVRNMLRRPDVCSFDYAPRSSAGIDWLAIVGLVFAAMSFAFIALHFQRYSLLQRQVNIAQFACIGAGIIALVFSGLSIWKSKNCRPVRAGAAVICFALGLIGTTGASVVRPGPGAYPVKCQSCMRQIGSALKSYAGQNGGLPPSTLLALNLNLNCGPTDFLCPTTGERRTIVLPKTAIPRRDNAILFYEPRPAESGANVVYVNGMVKFLTDAELIEKRDMQWP